MVTTFRPTRPSSIVSVPRAMRFASALMSRRLDIHAQAPGHAPQQESTRPRRCAIAGDRTSPLDSSNEAATAPGSGVRGRAPVEILAAVRCMAGRMRWARVGRSTPMDGLRARTRRFLSLFSRPAGPAAPKGEAPYRSPGERETEGEAPPPSARRYAPFVVSALAVGLLGVFIASRPADERAVATVADAAPAPSGLADVETAPVAAPERPPCTDAELRALIDEGKKATTKRKYDDARTAFEKALVCRPDDAEALSERGLMWYLSGDMEHATEDLALASRKTTKPGLLGTIWYRRGLVDEKVFSEEGAEPAYITSYWLGHHQGAMKKVGSNACGSTSSRFHAGAMGNVTLSDTHVDKLVATLEAGDAPRTGLGDDAGSTFPAVFEIDNGATNEDWLVAKGKTEAWAFRLASRVHVYHCRGASQFTLSKEGSIVHAHGYAANPSVEDKDFGGGAVQHGCFYGPVERVDAFFRPDRDMAIVVRSALPGRFDEREDVPAPKVTLTPRGVSIKGLGCDDAETWDDAADAGAGEGGAADGGDGGGAARDGGDGGRDGGDGKP